jgi:hypothetical protein
VLAVASVVLFGAGALHVARWLGERREPSDADSGASGRAAPAPLRRVAASDPRMDAFLSAAVAYGPVRRTPFGRDSALFTAGPSLTPPEQVFAEILGRFAPRTDPASLRRELERGPSAVSALRTRATVGPFPGGHYLVHLPPDAASALSGPVAGGATVGRLRTEPGGIVLAFAYDGGRYEYAAFYFPNGFDVGAFSRSTEAGPEVLAALGPEARGALSVEWCVGGDARGDLTTALCRSKGRAGDALDRVAAGLSARGYTVLAGSRPGVPGESGDLVRVLESGRGTIWLTTSERDVVGGLVTVTLAL